jgi:hypothetical protein
VGASGSTIGYLITFAAARSKRPGWALPPG